MNTRRRFRTGANPDQLWLLPPSLSDWLPADHPSFSWSALVDELDLSAIYATYGSKGQPPYDPRLMVKIWVYAYARGLRASRQVEQACYDDVGFRVVAGNQQPDFWTLAAFRRRHREALGDLLTESIRLAADVGLVKLRDVAVDGTKVQAAASKHRAMSYARMTDREAELATEVEQYLADVESADAVDDAAHGADDRGWTAPRNLADTQKRLETIRAAKARLEAEARERAAAKQAEREAAADAAGKPAPKPPDDPTRPDPKAQSNFTDPESRIMRNSDKAFIQGYNAQIAVDADTQIILAADVTNQAADSPHLLPMVDQVVENTGRRPVGVLADAGYWSETNRYGLQEREMEALIPPEKLRHREWRDARAPRGRIPRGLSPKDRMRRCLRTKAGRRRYRRRQVSVEPVIGYLKTTHRCRQFLIRGLAAVRDDWRFHCAVANLAKIVRNGQVGKFSPHRGTTRPV